MYRPDRIGPHTLWDPIQGGETPVLTTVMLSADGAAAPYSPSATVPEETNYRAFRISAPPAIASNKAMSIGIPINGAHKNDDLPNMFTVVGAFQTQRDNPINVSFGLGVSGASTVTVDVNALENNLSEWLELPTSLHPDGVVIGGHCRESVIEGRFAASASDPTKPKIAFIRFANHSGSTVQLTDLNFSISVHLYRGIIDTFDPTRG